MKQHISVALDAKANEVADKFSRSDRSGNTNNETFTIAKKIITSETSAAVFYRKNTGKLAVAFFYWIASGKGYWAYFFPGYEHLRGIAKVEEMLNWVEQENHKRSLENAG